MTRLPSAVPASHRSQKFCASPRCDDPMPSFRYRALTQSGEVVGGSISAPTAAEVARRIEYLGLIPIDTVAEGAAPANPRTGFSLLSRPRAEDVTVFTRDLALLLKAGARINDALELLASDVDIGRLR